MAGDIHIEVAPSELDGAHHCLLADTKGKVAQRAERQGVARSDEEAADRVNLLAPHAVSAVTQDKSPAAHALPAACGGRAALMYARSVSSMRPLDAEKSAYREYCFAGSVKPATGQAESSM